MKLRAAPSPPRGAAAASLRAPRKLRAAPRARPAASRPLSPRHAWGPSHSPPTPPWFPAEEALGGVMVMVGNRGRGGEWGRARGCKGRAPPRAATVTRGKAPPPPRCAGGDAAGAARKGLFKSCPPAGSGRRRGAGTGPRGPPGRAWGSRSGRGDAGALLRLSRSGRRPRREIKSKRRAAGPGADSAGTAMGSSSPRHRPS